MKFSLFLTVFLPLALIPNFSFMVSTNILLPTAIDSDHAGSRGGPVGFTEFMIEPQLNHDNLSKAERSRMLNDLMAR